MIKVTYGKGFDLAPQAMMRQKIDALQQELSKLPQDTPAVKNLPGADVQNAPHKVKFREQILTVQDGLQKLIADGAVKSTLEDCTLTHYFTPKDEKYGCCTYAREMFIPKGTLIIGKIHRHQHLNFISKGRVRVFTEFGDKYLEAPCTFVSEVGLKRAVYAEEDTLWTTVHLTQFEKEADLDKIETEVIAPSYAEMGLIDSTEKLAQLSAQGEAP